MKQKTVKTATKRFRFTKTGKILRRTISAQHLTAGKSKRTLRKNTKMQSVSISDKKNIKQMVPYR